MSTARPVPPSVRTHNLDPPRRTRTNNPASPTSYSFNPSPIKAYHSKSQTAGQILYDIPLPISPNPDSLVAGSSTEGFVGNVSEHPLIESSARNGLDSRSRSLYSNEKKTGNAIAYAQSRSGAAPRVHSRSRRGSRETMERMNLNGRADSDMTYGSSKELLTTSGSGSTLDSGLSPIKPGHDAGNRDRQRMPMPRRRSSESSSRATISTNQPSRSRPGPTPPPRLYTYQPPQLPPSLPSRRGSPSPNKQTDLLSPGGTMMREAKEGSMYTVGQQSVASSYARREGGVGSPSPGDLHTFAHHCHLFYFSSAPPSGSQSYIDATLAGLPPSHRAAYTRIQNSLRAQSHTHNTRLRLLAFHALITSTTPNGDLTPFSRQELRSKRAKTERHAKLNEFVTRWCQKSAIGVEPFFKALYVCLLLQGKGERGIGGAGGKRVVWEIDDAVFMEAGGKDFMNEAIAVIKGVLGFVDAALSVPPTLRRPTLPMLQPRPSFVTSNGTPRSSFTDQRNGNEVEQLIPLGLGISTTAGTDANRGRSTSDPFLDPSRSPAKSPDERYALPAKQVGKRGPAPPVPSHNRSASGKGPAPPVPASRNLRAPAPRMLQDRTFSQTSDGYSSAPLSPSVESPLLSARSNRDSDSVVTGLEEAAEREDTLASLGRASRDKLGLTGRNDRAPSDSQSASLSDARGLIGSAPMNGLNLEIALETEDYDIDEEEKDLSAPRLRLWTFPAHISDGELDGLLAIFPNHIRKAQGMRNMRFPLPRPTSIRAIKAHDLESGFDTDDGEAAWPIVLGSRVPPEDTYGMVAPGTGRLWLGGLPREAPWHRGFFERLRKWFSSLLGG